MVKKIPAETYFGEKKIPANSNAKKKKKTQKKLQPPPFPPPQKLNNPSLNQFRNKSSNTI